MNATAFLAFSTASLASSMVTTESLALQGGEEVSLSEGFEALR